MSVLRFLATAAACAAVAFAAGQFMESGVSRAAATPVDLPEAHDRAPVLRAASPDAAPRIAMLADAPAPPRAPSRLSGIDAAETAACDLRLTATPRPGAMAEIEIDAPCAAHAAVMLRHHGLSMTLRGDARGQASALVPALSREAVFMAEAAGSTAIASTMLPDMEGWQRVALLSRAGAAVSLYDAAGAGEIVTLGAPALPDARLTEIHSAPMDQIPRLSVEIEVTAGNCGRPVAAELLRLGAGGELSSTMIELTLPGCDAVGELLVLQNLEPETTVAAR